MSHDPKLFSQQQQPPKTTNIFIGGNNPPAYQQEDNQQRKVPNLLESRENTKNESMTFSVITDLSVEPVDKKLNPAPTYNRVYRQQNPKRPLTTQESVQLPCNHYKPPANEIKTWMFDGFREWCPYCNQLTNGENLIRSGPKLSGMAKYKLAVSATSPRNIELDEDDEGNESDLEESYINQGYERFNNPRDDSNTWTLFGGMNQETARLQNMTEKYQEIHVSRVRTGHYDMGQQKVPEKKVETYQLDAPNERYIDPFKGSDYNKW